MTQNNEERDHTNVQLVQTIQREWALTEMYDKHCTKEQLERAERVQRGVSGEEE